MLNQVVLVGRLTNNLVIEGNEENKRGEIVLAVQRCFKDTNGEYRTDFIPCVLYNMVAQNTAEYCKKGDIVGVKGRLQVEDNKVMVIAEKITFLSSKKEEE